MGDAPRLCVGLTVYNGSRYLPEALESVLSQTFTDLEVVISDNCSTDATAEICRRYAAMDSRIRYHRNAVNIGAGPNFNKCVELCHSPLFKWMAHDDMLEPDFLAQAVRILDQRDDAVLAHSELRLIDDDGETIPWRVDRKIIDRNGNRHHDREPSHLGEAASPSVRFDEVMRKMNWCMALFGVIRTQALKRTNLLGGYYEADRVLLGELALLGPFVQLDQPLIVKRCHAGVSVLKSFRDQALMMDPSLAPLLPGLRLRMGYANTLTVGDLPAGERMACALTVGRLFLRNTVTYRARRWIADTVSAVMPRPRLTGQ